MRQAVFTVVVTLAVGFARPASAQPTRQNIPWTDPVTGVDPAKDSLLFFGFVIKEMGERGVPAETLSPEFHFQLGKLSYETARRIPQDFHLFAHNTGKLKNNEITKLFLLLRDDPEHLPDFILVRVSREVNSSMDRGEENRFPGFRPMNEAEKRELDRYNRKEPLRGMFSSGGISEVFRKILKGMGGKGSSRASGPPVSATGPVEAVGPADPEKSSGPAVDARFYYEGTEEPPTEAKPEVSLKDMAPAGELSPTGL